MLNPDYNCKCLWKGSPDVACVNIPRVHRNTAMLRKCNAFTFSLYYFFQAHGKDQCLSLNVSPSTIFFCSRWCEDSTCSSSSSTFCLKRKKSLFGKECTTVLPIQPLKNLFRAIILYYVHRLRLGVSNGGGIFCVLLVHPALCLTQIFEALSNCLLY